MIINGQLRRTRSTVLGFVCHHHVIIMFYQENVKLIKIIFYSFANYAQRAMKMYDGQQV